MKHSAIIKTSSGKSVEIKEIAGVFSCLLEHKVSETKAQFEYTGPRIAPETWNEILGFFRWSQETHQSEAQVRLFVHPEQGWLAFAFPQEGGTGMTTKEIDGVEFQRQRAELIPAGFTAFGTVHHHCNSPAFQSGTDSHDEASQDGLHITVGNILADKHSIHCRVYLKAHMFEPRMNAFWDIGDAARETLEMVSNLGFDIFEVADRMARQQMCVPVPKDSPFPPQWKENYLVKKSTTSVAVSSGHRGVGIYGGDRGGWCQKCGEWSATAHVNGLCPNPHKRDHWEQKNINEAVENVWNSLSILGMTDEDILETVAILAAPESEPIQLIAKICEDSRPSVSFKTLHEAFILAIKEADETKQKRDSTKVNTDLNGEGLGKNADKEGRADSDGPQTRTAEEMQRMYMGGEWNGYGE